MTDEWYWSLKDQRAVRADERPKATDVLGPYPTKEAAENWQATVENRNDDWDEADRRWDGDDNDD